jgi:hypothetical protein
MPYSTAIDCLETKVVAAPNGKPGLQIVRRIKDLDNYGEIWYYTKLNEDNAWIASSGLRTMPDAQGRWPLRENGWGHGFTWDVAGQRQSRQYGWHRYGAWVALVTALEADLPKSREAWQVMSALAGAQGEYGMEMMPRTKHRDGSP